MIPLPQDYSDITTPSIQIQQLNEKDINAPFHFHHEFELSLIYGKGKRLIGNHVESIHGIDLVLCGKNIPHCWFDCKRTHAITIHFSPQSGGNNNCSIPEMSGIKHLLKQSEKGLHFRGTTSRSGAHGLKVYARYIERMLHHDEFERLITLSRILKLMAEDPGRKEISGIGFSTLSNSHHVKLNHALNYIFENFTLDISIQELSDQRRPCGRCRAKLSGQSLSACTQRRGDYLGRS